MVARISIERTLRTPARKFPEFFSCKDCNQRDILLFVMTSPSPTNDPASPKVLRVDPSPSKAFSWMEWREAAEEARDTAGRLLQPAGPSFRVRYRTTGAEWEAFPVSEEEAVRVLRPGAEFDYSSGRAYSQLIAPYKSKRLVKTGDRQATQQQRAEVEQRAGRRWLA